MNHNPHNLKVGDTVILDADYNNHSEVTIISLSNPNQMFAMVANASSPTWQVMTSRLTPKVTPQGQQTKK